jgi:hypothetical protein
MRSRGREQEVLNILDAASSNRFLCRSERAEIVRDLRAADNAEQAEPLRSADSEGRISSARDLAAGSQFAVGVFSM